MHPSGILRKATFSFNYLCYPISLSLTLLLTLMIIVRLVLHSRNMRDAMGSGVNGSKLYKAIATMIVESYALYAVSFIVVIALMDAKSYMELIFDPILAGAQVRFFLRFHDAGILPRWKSQVIASYLVILRVANRRAFTSDTVASKNGGSMHFRTQEESLDGNWTIHDENPMIWVEKNGEKDRDSLEDLDDH